MKWLAGTPNPLSWRHRFPVVGRWHSPLRLGPTHPRPQKPVVDQLLQLPLHHRGIGPSVRREDLSLARHCCRSNGAGKGTTVALDGG
jgi:hypothetical protein